MKQLLPAFCLIAITAFGADVTGKYAGTITPQEPGGESHKDGAYMDLKQDGDKLTGVAGPNESETHNISNGKIDGDTVTFEIDTGKMVMRVVLKHDNGKLQGEATAERDGAKIRALLELSKK